MKKNLKWKKRESFKATVSQTKESCQTNEEGWPLFIIEKNNTKKFKNPYRLFSATNCMIARIIGEFKTQQKAKQVAELIYSDSRYARKKTK